jgi:hypothetical protein
MAGTEQFTGTDSQIALENQNVAPGFNKEPEILNALPPADTAQELPGLADAEENKDLEEIAEKKASSTPPVLSMERSYSPASQNMQKDRNTTAFKDSIKFDILLKDTVLLAYSLIITPETENPVKEKETETVLKNSKSKSEEKQESRREKKAETRKKQSTDSAKLTEISSTTGANKPIVHKPVAPTNKSIKVEFWQSPINFKGYKYFRNKLYLYGLKPNEEISIFTYNEKLYLKTQKGVFIILEQNSYNPFIQVKNPELIEHFR